MKIIHSKVTRAIAATVRWAIAGVFSLIMLIPTVVALTE